MPKKSVSEEDEKKRIKANKLLDMNQQKEIENFKTARTNRFDSTPEISQTQKTSLWNRILSFFGFSSGNESKIPEVSNRSQTPVFGREGEDLPSQTTIDDVLLSSEKVAVQDAKPSRIGSISSNDSGFDSGSIGGSEGSFSSQSSVFGAGSKGSFGQSYIDQTRMANKTLAKTPYTGQPQYGSAPNLSGDPSLTRSSSSTSVSSSGYGSKTSVGSSTSSIGKKQVKMANFVAPPVVPSKTKSASMPNLSPIGEGVKPELRKPTRAAPSIPTPDSRETASDSLKVGKSSSSMLNLSSQSGDKIFRKTLEDRLSQIKETIFLPRKLRHLLDFHKDIGNDAKSEKHALKSLITRLQSYAVQEMKHCLKPVAELQDELTKITARPAEKSLTDSQKNLSGPAKELIEQGVNQERVLKFKKLVNLNMQAQSAIDYTQHIDPTSQKDKSEAVEKLKTVLAASLAESKKCYKSLEKFTKELEDIKTKNLPLLKKLYNMQSELRYTQEYLIQTTDTELKKESTGFKDLESKLLEKIESCTNQYLEKSSTNSVGTIGAVNEAIECITQQDSLSATEKVTTLQELRKYLEFRATNLKNRTQQPKKEDRALIREAQALEKAIPSVSQTKWQTFIDERAKDVTASKLKNNRGIDYPIQELTVEDKIYTIKQTLRCNESEIKQPNKLPRYGTLSFNEMDKEALITLQKELEKELKDLRKTAQKDSGSKSASQASKALNKSHNPKPSSHLQNLTEEHRHQQRSAGRV